VNREEHSPDPQAPLEAEASYGTVAVGTMCWRAIVHDEVAAQARIMGEFTIGKPRKIGGWIATAVVAASAGRWASGRR
jgi:hypothetical protein